MGGGEGRGIGADDIAGVMPGAFAGIFAAAFGADLRAAFLRAGFAFRAVLRFPGGRPRRLAVARLPFFPRLLAAAERRFVPLAFARAPFLRPRFDFDFDPERAIKPPVSGMKFAASSVALRRPARMQEENGFVKPIPVRIIGHLIHWRGKYRKTALCCSLLLVLAMIGRERQLRSRPMQAGDFPDLRAAAAASIRLVEGARMLREMHVDGEAALECGGLCAPEQAQSARRRRERADERSRCRHAPTRFHGVAYRLRIDRDG